MMKTWEKKELREVLPRFLHRHISFLEKKNVSSVCSSKSYLKFAFVTTAVSNNMHNSTQQQH